MAAVALGASLAVQAFQAAFAARAANVALLLLETEVADVAIWLAFGSLQVVRSDAVLAVVLVAGGAV